MYSYMRKYGKGTTKDDLKGLCKGDGWSIPKNSYDEVYPGIILGDGQTAMSCRTLVREGVTHILNMAFACPECESKIFCGTCVLTRPSLYPNIKFKGLHSYDDRFFPLYKLFEECCAFIEEALKSGGKIYIHCQHGISRSATIICAYLMLRKGMGAAESVRTVKRKRNLYPNDGFLEQLCDLEIRLKSRVYA